MLGTAAPSARPVSWRSAATPRAWPREQIVSAIVVLAVACLLRLPAPDLTPFGHDEALEAARARPIWYGARPVDSEITSWWIPDPAGLLYFFALAEAFPRPAIARVELVAAINVVAVLITYLLARRFFGPAVALAAGLLYAANPWAVTFGRQPWVITQPVLTALMLLAAMMVVVRRDGRWVVPFFVAGAAQTQTHLLAVLYAPPAALTLLLFFRRWPTRQVLLGAAVAALMVAPYTLHLWELRDEIAEALARGNRGLMALPDLTAAKLTLWLVSGYRLDAKLGFPSPLLDGLQVPLLVVALVAGLLLVTGTLVAARACLRRESGWEARALLLIWFLAPLALMTWQTSAVYIHYVLVLVPTAFVLMGLGAGLASGLLANLPRLLFREGGSGVGSLAVVLPICAVQMGAVAAFYAALEASLAAPPTAVSPTEWQAALNRVELGAKQAGIGELHGLPLRYWQSVADRTKIAAAALPRTDPADRPRDVVVITGILDDANRHLDRRRKALDYLLGPELEARFPLEGLTILPTLHDTVYLTIPEQSLPRPASRGASRLDELLLPGTSGATRIWLVRARPLDEAVQPRARAEAAFEPGIRVVGVDAPARAEAGQSIPLTGYWLVERAPPGGDEQYQPVVELLDRDGRARASVARGGLPSTQWRMGDVLIQRASLHLPLNLAAGEYRLAAGLGASGRDTRIAPATDPSARSAPIATLRVRGRD